jgi:hypothetical protein
VLFLFGSPMVREHMALGAVRPCPAYLLQHMLLWAMHGLVVGTS